MQISSQIKKGFEKYYNQKLSEKQVIEEINSIKRIQKQDPSRLLFDAQKQELLFELGLQGVKLGDILSLE